MDNNSRLRPLTDQVVVITGASSGIGLVTARLAAERGARVVLAARNAADLEQAVESIRQEGGRAVHVLADVTEPEQVERIATTAMQEFGGVDTWVNNAAAAMYGKATDLELEDMRRQMDVVFWSVVYGSRTAVKHLGEKGGAIINVASVLADWSVPLQAIYCAAKHAVKGFTDALRMELERDGLPISVTLIKPASMDTPFFEKARNYLREEPQPVPPVYAPEVTARAILRAAERPVREVVAGGVTRVFGAARAVSPRLADRWLGNAGFEQQLAGRPARPFEDNNLYEPVAWDGGERGHSWLGRVHELSLYDTARGNPGRTALAVGMLGLAAVLGARAMRRD